MPDDATAATILAYLRRIPGYPFDASIDEPFVAELADDFSALDLLEQIKAFRWHHDGDPARHFKSLRPAIRRWLASARPSNREPF
jgi:hypothetical protein